VGSISAGTYQTCLVSTSGAASCWGQANHGQLGNGVDSTQKFSFPQPVRNLAEGVVDIVAGLNISCAKTTSREAYCWGSNSFGQLGNRSTNSARVPAEVVIE